ncbi:DUF411 domain-containing protein [Hydrogenivirga sp. 128-5-R1-1]|uniref:DUF411 domain-containing protein n=1 Tax=Hydrogenivirga sp. 128-5-R1-1 TaxID=392423 RepID=UPI00015F0CD9|nr:DUF411 domain-containing protein [Hydrogenivirga sp. 128-5-R1-1]EDP75939.1 hypothetical protein HG1285_06420 [Hydrogenivirga sp. 128-5-R1-1]
MRKLLIAFFIGSLGFSFAKEITAFYNPNCGCCHKYFQRLEKKGYKLNRVEVSPDDLFKKKDELGVPVNKRSCHTMVMGDKFIEGHVPVKGIEALAKDKKAKGVYSPHGTLSGWGAEEETYELIK